MTEQLGSIDDMTRFLASVRPDSQILLWRPWEAASSHTYGLDIDVNGTMYACLLNDETAAFWMQGIHPPTKLKNVDEAITYFNNLRVQRGNIPTLAQFTEEDSTQPIPTVVVKSNGSYAMVLTNETGAEVLRDQNS
ncbi:hypothetical protein [Streptomyces sp. SudanB52_2052]|uniref:hypothetical protein n=1 Tax=Streptomyces sp. SudanB52_2052 TaxID=3035276 RepID=UPI003F575F78